MTVLFSTSADQLATHEGGGGQSGEPAGHGRRLGHGLAVEQLCALDARCTHGAGGERDCSACAAAWLKVAFGSTIIDQLAFLASM